MNFSNKNKIGEWFWYFRHAAIVSLVAILGSIFLSSSKAIWIIIGIVLIIIDLTIDAIFTKSMDTRKDIASAKEELQKVTKHAYALENEVGNMLKIVAKAKQEFDGMKRETLGVIPLPRLRSISEDVESLNNQNEDIRKRLEKIEKNIEETERNQKRGL